MFLKPILFLTLLSGFATVLCAVREVCDFSDEDCVTNGDKPLFKLSVAGNDSLGMENLDPHHVETINIKLSNNMNYILKNAYIYGLKDCDGRKLKFAKDLTWYFDLICPRLVLKADYFEKGVVDSTPIEGKGKIVITYDNVEIENEGKVEVITGSDGKPHGNITYHKIVHMDVKDIATYYFTNLFSTDNEKSEKAHKYMNDNWKEVTSEMQYSTLQALIDRFFDNKNKLIAVIPVNELFYKNP